MKKLLLLLAIVLTYTSVYAQSPDKMSYQAIIRDAVDALVVNTPVGMQISILQGSTAGAAVYVETHSSTTNSNGLVSLEIGMGTATSGTFSGIDWTAGPYFIKTETDPSGGTNYSITGTTELLSVPYAMYANTSGSSTPGPQGPAGNDGADGAQGPAGPAGADGAQGPAGNDGADGAQGPAGNDGADGAQGPAGPAGADGAQGPAGNDGADGAQGPAGNDGADGAQGPAGPAGADGAQGPAGNDGADGAQGPAGPAGADGAQGPAGNDGADGPQGPAGPAGADGAQGPAGNDGADGQGGVTQAGTGITVSGTGTAGDPYIVSTTINGIPPGGTDGQILQMVGGVLTWVSGPPSCEDGIQNQDETAVDCGGTSCSACITGCMDATAHNYDATVQLDDGSCETCSDGIQNGDEAAIDCGGSNPACTPCITGCMDATAHNYDATVQLDDGSCETCSDGIQNGDEAAIDCGGSNPACTPCITGCMDATAHNYDATAQLDDGSCETCTDGILNGDETGIDCGGATCPTCPGTCTDGIQNQDETGIDCGGASCPACSTTTIGLNGTALEVLSLDPVLQAADYLVYDWRKNGESYLGLNAHFAESGNDWTNTGRNYSTRSKNGIKLGSPTYTASSLESANSGQFGGGNPDSYGYDMGDINQVEGGASLAFSIWVYPVALSPNDPIVEKWDGVNSGWQVSTGSNGSQLMFKIKKAGVDYTAETTTGVLSTNTWHHIFVQYNGGSSNPAFKVRIFVNGTNKSTTDSATFPTTLGTSSNKIRIRTNYNQSSGFRGQYESVMATNIVWNGMKNELYNAGVPRYDIVDNTIYNPGESWECVITPITGGVAGTPVTSNTFVIP